ncbi:CRISPR-associated endonuclease Cas2 [Gemella sp. GH3]|uniref:CRISPR-associated endonuclease Cas2 n=1 Tax=unclassified Gemella TaxID=2624949 RepID=UPI0015D0B75C|nr:MULTISPECIES: CRISPR-associated endonuclease Cas2 [unclassified Gemella]MBF0714026.1 CRISPR-associated endonuclease Cas2 [Gemella sp. GH3.1]NYS50978.1 CRISPR-associated endonuclease Cas2 [Gemella sp. GH3]
MRIIVMFDLPTEYSSQRKSYRKFRKQLIKDGFIMLQESIYCKLALNSATASLIINNIKKYCPDEGIVQILTVTEKQFSKMEILVGDINNEYIDSDERFIEL